MRQHLYLVLPALVVLLTSGCGPDEADVPLALSDGANAVWRVNISGLHCDGCASGLRSELLRTEGVITAEVQFQHQLAQIAVDTNRVTLEALSRVVAEAGYEMGDVQP